MEGGGGRGGLKVGEEGRKEGKIRGEGGFLHNFGVWRNNKRRQKGSRLRKAGKQRGGVGRQGRKGRWRCR